MLDYETGGRTNVPNGLKKGARSVLLLVGRLFLLAANITIEAIN